MTEDQRRDETAGREELLRVGTSLYRDEMRRVTNWRTRLDTTSNWAVVLCASILTFAFSSKDNPHYLLLVAMGGVLTFAFIEARRYRHYDVWRSRIRLLERFMFAEVYDASDRPGVGDWTKKMAEDLRRPTYKISFIRALHHRLRRIHLALLLILGVSWVARITSYEDGKLDIIEDAAIGVITGDWVVGVIGLLLLAALVLAVWPFDVRGSLQPEEDDSAEEAWD